MPSPPETPFPLPPLPGATAPRAPREAAAHHPLGEGSLSLAELRALAGRVAHLPAEEVPPGHEAAAHSFNGVVSRFRELVVAARNQLVLGRPVPSDLGTELRALADALPGERHRVARPDVHQRRPA